MSSLFGSSYHREHEVEIRRRDIDAAEAPRLREEVRSLRQQLGGAVAVLRQVLAAYDEHGPSNPPMPILDALIEAEDFIRDHGGGQYE